MDEILQEYTTPVAAAGSRYKARALGSRRSDGTWEGSIEFLPLDGAAPVRTERETSQPNREDLVYWASGLEPVYLAGALERALRTR